MGPEGISDQGVARSARRTGGAKPNSHHGKENRLKNDEKRQNDIGEAEYRQRNIAYLERNRKIFQDGATGIFVWGEIIMGSVIVRVFMRDAFRVIALAPIAHRVICHTNHQCEQPACQDQPRDIA